jgi:pentatricopeptide repeat protein
MRDWGYMPDEITYNTLLKLCVRKNDLEGAKEILNTMKTFNIIPSGYTKSLLINIYSMNNQTDLAIDLILSEKDEYITPYMYASAIGACKTNYKQALMLLQKASLNNKADEAVFTITAKVLSKQKEYMKSFKVIDAMLLRGLSFNKFSFSFIINALLEYQMSGNDSIQLLQKYLNIVKVDNPFLLTNAVCQKVIKDLLLCNQSPVAAMLHLDIFTYNTCKPDTLGELFKDLQVIYI